MIDYAFYPEYEMEFPLKDEIQILTSSKEQPFIANSKKLNPIVYAPEINFYMKNSKDNITSKIENISTLYKIREIAYENAKYNEYKKEVNNRLLIIGSKEEIEKLPELKDFDVYYSLPEWIEDIKGTIGNLNFLINKGDTEIELEVDQAIWFDAPEKAYLQAGIIDPEKIGIAKAVEIIKRRLGTYEYKNYITYDQNICQFHKRVLKETCTNCVDVCPTNAITKNDEFELVFSHVDCDGCGGCVSVCPSGALDFSLLPRDGFYQISRLFNKKIPLIIAENLIEDLQIDLKENVLPLAIEGRKFLDETHFLTLFQESGAQIIFYSDAISKGEKEAIKMLNEISKRKYNKEMIFIPSSKEELEESIKNAGFIENSHYTINEANRKKREIFASRLSYLVGEDDLGVLDLSENRYIHYGSINIDESKCTLCMSCVSVCNAEALKTFEKEGELKFDASVCTDCGYCEVACPEKCIEVVYDKLELNPSYFGQKLMAKDEPFYCIMCGKPFAPKKSIEKIASTLLPVFTDELKKKSIYCCPECKAKLLFSEYIKNKEQL